jgi:hypothetical protein
MTLYALFLHGEPVSKPHTTRRAAVVEAFERGAVERGCPDFPEDPESYRLLALAKGYEISYRRSMIVRLRQI